jgi:hypothetical protein
MECLPCPINDADKHYLSGEVDIETALFADDQASSSFWGCYCVQDVKVFKYSRS